MKLNDFSSPAERRSMNAKQFAAAMDKMSRLLGYEVTNAELGKVLNRTPQNVSLYRNKAGLDYPLSFVIRVTLERIKEHASNK